VPWRSLLIRMSVCVNSTQLRQQQTTHAPLVAPLWLTQ
jgi:hypothetical protein